MKLIKKTTASLALVALTSGMLVNGTSAYSQAEVAAAELLASKGIVVKQSKAADYQLDRQVLRQEIAAVSRGLANLEKTTTCTNLFKDVSATKPNTWACYTVEALANAGLIAKNATFRPESNITKAEAVGMVVKARYGNEYNPVAGNGSWEKQVVDFAVSKGIVSNFTNYTTPATRGFVFEVAAKTYKELPLEDNLLCELLGTCPTKTETTKEPVKDNSVMRNDSDLFVSLSPENPSNGMVAANTPRTQLLAITVTAGKEDVTLKKASLKFTGTGDQNSVQDLSIYSEGVSLTRNTGVFNSKLESNLSFDRDTVVKAGTTKTLFVTGKIQPVGGSYNQIVRVSLVGLEASAAVKGADLTGASLTPYLVSNVGKAKADSSSNTGKIYVAETSPIYTFNIKEESKKEDIEVQSITFSKEGTADLEDLTNLSLNLDGKEVKATFTYKKDKIVASLKETIKSSGRGTFTLKGQMIDGLNKTLGLKITDVYAVGKNTNLSVDVNLASIQAISKTIAGSSINFSYNQTDIKEVSQNSNDAKVADLVFVTTTNYTATVKITVSGTGLAYQGELELDGQLVTPVNGTNSAGQPIKTYTFKNVDLNKGTTKLPLTVDILDNSLATGSLTYNVQVSDIRNEDLSETVNNNTLNNNNLSRSVNIVKSGLTIKDTAVRDTETTSKGNPEVVLYKGTIDVNGSENITVNNMKFTVSGGDLQTILSGVKLNIGGKTFTGDRNTGTIDFNNVFATIQSGSKNVEFMVTAVLSEREITTNDTLTVTNISSDLSAEKSTPTNIINQVVTSPTVVTITPRANLAIVSASTTNDRTVMAGVKNAEIGSFRVNSTTTAFYVDNLELDYVATGSNVNSIKNIKLMNGTEVIATGSIEAGNKIVFKNFNFPVLSKNSQLTVVADLPAINTYGGEEKPFIGTFKLTNVKVVSQDANANTPITSALVDVSAGSVVANVSDTLGNKDEISTLKVVVSKDSSSEFDTFILESLEFEANADKIADIQVNGRSLTKTLVGNKLEFANVNNDLKGLNEFELKVITNTTVNSGALRLTKINTKATSDNENYVISNNASNTMYLGSYTN